MITSHCKLELLRKSHYLLTDPRIVSLHLGSTCDDYLQIIEFNRPIYTFCGITSFRTPFYFTSRRLLLIFRTSSEDNFLGFQLTLEQTSEAPYYPLGRCGYQQMATSQNQNLHSPFAPYVYPNNMACTWTIAARRGYCIHATIVKFRTTIQDNLIIETEGQIQQILNGTNHILPIILPLFCPMVYLRFVTHNLTVEQGFQIVYREHPSPNSAPTQLSSPSKTEFQTPLMPSANNTFFSAVLHQLDSLIAGNLLTANQLEYVQTQLNDRLEEFSYQLGTHVQIIANTSCTSVNHSFTAYAPLFLTTNMLCSLYPLYLSFFRLFLPSYLLSFTVTISLLSRLRQRPTQNSYSKNTNISTWKICTYNATLSDA